MAPRGDSNERKTKPLLDEASATSASTSASSSSPSSQTTLLGLGLRTGNYFPPDDGTTKSTAPAIGSDGEGLLGKNFAELPLLQRLNWIHVPLLVLTPLMAIVGIALWRFNVYTLVFATAYYFATGLGITAGYHRLFAHRAYKATPTMRILLLLLGAGAVEGSARWWSRDHRAHHRYVDTDRDPYAIIKGFWHAHIGWMLVKQDKTKIGRADISDLSADPWVVWQHNNYLALAVIMGAIVPTLVCGLWGDFWGGYFVAGIARLVFVHHSTFFVNSLAHYAGKATFSDAHTARNSIITAVLTIGEGYHNFHHEFPQDYRNGVEHYQYDPTKWFIGACSYLGLTYDLKKFPANEINKGRLLMKQRKLNQAKSRLYSGPDPSTLPALTREQVVAKVAGGSKWVILDGFVLDVAQFMGDHPGGSGLVSAVIGEDITEKFRGGYYKHSLAARNLSSTFRVARVAGYWS